MVPERKKIQKQLGIGLRLLYRRGETPGHIQGF
jgi:hypothetical protein